MTRRWITALAAAATLVLAFAHPASADDPGYVKPPYVCGPTQMPSQVPCDQLPSTTTTTLAFKYCLGYPQQFPRNTPCPRPTDETCSLPSPPVDCDPHYNPTPPVAPEPGGTVPPVTTTAPVASSDDVSATTTPIDTPHPVQRRSAPPRRRVVTTTTTTPPLFFVLGQWLTYDEFVSCVDLMGP